MSNVSNQSWAFTIFRVAVGGVFLAHGIQKFFMYGLHGVAGAFASMGVPAPAVTSALVAVVELLGGAALILGFLTGWAAALNDLVGGVHRYCDPRAGSGVGRWGVGEAGVNSRFTLGTGRNRSLWISFWFPRRPAYQHPSA